MLPDSDGSISLTVCIDEQLLEEWCGQIEAYLEGGGKPGDGAGDAAKGGAPKRGGGASAAVAVVVDEGPKGELEYWRNR